MFLENTFCSACGPHDKSDIQTSKVEKCFEYKTLYLLRNVLFEMLAQKKGSL